MNRLRFLLGVIVEERNPVVDVRKQLAAFGSCRADPWVEMGRRRFWGLDFERQALARLNTESVSVFGARPVDRSFDEGGEERPTALTDWFRR